MSDVKRWHSAYPGSMFKHQAGDYADEFVRADLYDALAAENAALRKERDKAESAVSRYETTINERDAENAALRAAAGKVTCLRCRGTGTHVAEWPCPDCADLRKLLGEQS